MPLHLEKPRVLLQEDGPISDLQRSGGVFLYVKRRPGTGQLWTWSSRSGETPVAFWKESLPIREAFGFDGRRVFVSTGEALLAVTMSGTQELYRTTSRIEMPCLSSDGRTLAWLEEKDWAIHIATIGDGMEHRTLPLRGPATALAWGGATLAYTDVEPNGSSTDVRTFSGDRAGRDLLRTAHIVTALHGDGSARWALCAGLSTEPGQHSAGVWLSDDGGTNWRCIANGFGREVISSTEGECVFLSDRVGSSTTVVVAVGGTAYEGFLAARAPGALVRGREVTFRTLSGGRSAIVAQRYSIAGAAVH